MNLIKQSNMLKCQLDDIGQFSDAQYMEMDVFPQGTLMHCQKAQLNGITTLLYDTKAYNTLESCASHLTAPQFRQLLSDLLCTLSTLRKEAGLRAMTEQNLHVEFDKTYVHNETLKLALIYIPVTGGSVFSEAELRNEIYNTIGANDALWDDGNDRIRNFVKDPSNDLLALIDLIPTLRNATSEPAAVQVASAQSEILKNLTAENKRIKKTMLALAAAVLLVAGAAITIAISTHNDSVGNQTEQVTDDDEENERNAGQNPETESATPVPTVLGDLDGDGGITTDDYTLLDQHLRGTELLSDAQFAVADVNEDGAVTVDDLAKMLLMVDAANHDGATDGSLGDLDGDGSITSVDYTLLEQHLRGIELLTDTQFALADINKDGAVTADDLASMLLLLPAGE